MITGATEATVLEQRPSAAKKGMYITLIKDRWGELKTYTTRKLEVGQPILITIRQGAARDPLSVTILSKKQEEEFRAQNP